MKNIIQKVLIEGNMQFKHKLALKKEELKRDPFLPKYPILIITCIDTRIDINRIFQINPDDVIILRNFGNILSIDMVKSILIAINKYKIENIIILGHIDCNLNKSDLDIIKNQFHNSTVALDGDNIHSLFYKSKDDFIFFDDELKNIKEQIENLKNLFVFSHNITILGMLYDISTGWVFEYDYLKDFKDINQFMDNYKGIIKNKENNYSVYLKTTGETIKNEQNLTLNLSQDIHQNTNHNSVVDKNNEDFNSNGLKNQEKVGIDLNSFAIKSNIIENLWKINIPKINLPKLRFNLLKNYKNEEKE